jgi:hypothetical protein
MITILMVIMLIIWNIIIRIWRFYGKKSQNSVENEKVGKSHSVESGPNV